MHINVWNRHPIPTPIPITTIATQIPIQITTISTPIPTPPKLTTNDSDSNSDSGIGVGIILWFRLREELEEVKSFVYLGSPINTEVSCMPEVNRRLCMARSTIENMTTIWKSQAICKSLKLRIARATAFAVATYGCEWWAYSKKVTKKIEAFEMWTYRRLLRVSWRQHKTNAWILEQLRTKPMLVKQMWKRKMKHFGHIIRHNSLEKTIIQGITAGKRGRGRPARTWERET